jgi:Septum formation
MRAGLGTTIVVVLLTALTGCSSGSSDSAEKPSGSASASSAPPAPEPPQAGSCHALSFVKAGLPVDSSDPVPCRGSHTTQTFKVGTLAGLFDGHLLAVDSPAVQARLGKTCVKALPAYLGGDQTTQRLGRLGAVWFGPSLEQADAGADWYRCDVIGLRKENSLISLPRTMKGSLDAPDALDRFGTCGTAAPDAPVFERVVCADKHSWRAIDVVDLPASTRYLAKDAAATGDATCKDVAAKRANGALKYTWSFEWPSRTQWAAGQRYGYCWVPEAG